jgi:glycosyltransferase involved in cell wall biosynthesis
MNSILVDAGPLLESHWTGIPVYSARLIRLIAQDPAIDSAFMIHGRVVERSRIEQALMLGTGLYLRSAYERGIAVDRSERKQFQKVLYPSVKSAFHFAPSEASVVHDLTTIVTPEFHVEANISFHRNNIIREIDTNEVTFATSEATASDICYYLDVPRDRIKVAYQFVDWPAEYPLMFQSRYPSDATLPYVLVIGTIEPRKNLSLVFTALKEILETDDELKVLVLGRAGWHLDQVLAREIAPFVDAGRLLFTGFVSEFKKYCILRLCRFTIFPSLMEGFGIPVLESLTVGRTVLASLSSSIPEVGGDAVTYFDPLSKDDFVEAFRSLYAETSAHPQKFVQVAHRVAARFTPESFFKPFKEWILS